MRLLAKLRAAKGKRVSLDTTCICPNALVQYSKAGTLDIYCGVTDDIIQYRADVFPFEDVPYIDCPVGGDYICFKYKEEDILKPIDAKKLGDHYVSVGCIAKVKVDKDCLHSRLINKYCDPEQGIVGRIVKFADSYLTLDTSKAFNNSSIDIYYESIVCIKDITEERIPKCL